MIGGDGEQVGDPPGFGLRTERPGGNKKAANDAEGAQKIDRIIRKPFPKFHARHSTTDQT